MSDGMGRERAYLSSHATNRYFIPNWGIKLYTVVSSQELRGRNKVVGYIQKREGMSADMSSLNMCYGVGGLLTLLHFCLEVCKNIEVTE